MSPPTPQPSLLHKCVSVCVTHSYDGVELGHGDLLGSLHRLNHLLLML